VDVQAHWQAFYDALRVGLNAAGETEVPVVHVTSEDGPLVAAVTPPFVAYRDETFRTVGTTGGGSLKVVRSNWAVTVRSANMAEATDLATVVLGALVDVDVTTSDGYQTTALEPIGSLSLWEEDAEVYAIHLRFLWERSV
jgi:hypothetical protein